LTTCYSIPYTDARWTRKNGQNYYGHKNHEHKLTAEEAAGLVIKNPDKWHKIILALSWVMAGRSARPPSSWLMGVSVKALPGVGIREKAIGKLLESLIIEYYSINNQLI